MLVAIILASWVLLSYGVVYFCLTVRPKSETANELGRILVWSPFTVFAEVTDLTASWYNTLEKTSFNNFCSKLGYSFIKGEKTCDHFGATRLEQSYQQN